MTADFSRNSYRPEKAFTGVRLQQGRVQLDADWNEQVDIVNSAMRQHAVDVIGTSGAPADGEGFRVDIQNALTFDGDGYLQGETAEAFSVAGLAPFSVQISVASAVHKTNGALCCGFDVTGRVWYSLEIDEAGRLVGQRGHSEEALLTEPIDWSRPHEVALVFTGQELQVWVDGAVAVSEPRTDELDVHRVTPQVRSEAVPDESPVVEGEEEIEEANEDSAAAGAGENAPDEVQVLAMAFRIGASISDSQPRDGFVGQITAARLWDGACDPALMVGSLQQTNVRASSPNLLGDWQFNDGFGAIVLDASDHQNLLHMHAGTEGRLPVWVMQDLSVCPGHFYVDGIRCHNPQRVALTGQPMCPGLTLPEEDGVYIAYIDAWERTVSSLEDEVLREVALGGADTAVRTQIVPQVRWLQVQTDPGAPLDVSQPHDHPMWRSLVTQTCIRGSLAARRTGRVASEAIENRLYRVEIHRGGIRLGPTPPPEGGLVSVSGEIVSPNIVELEQAGEPWVADQWVRIERLSDTHIAQIVAAEDGQVSIEPSLPKGWSGSVMMVAVASAVWSDNNAADVFEIDQIGETEILIRKPAHAGAMQIVRGDVISVSDETARLGGDPRVLRTVLNIGPDGRSLTLSEALPTRMVEAPGGTKMARIWRKSPKAKTNTLPVSDGWAEMEHGVEVEFSGHATHAAGDAWVIPSRTHTRNVEWPQGPNGPEARPPMEGEHHLAPLAVLRVKEGGMSVEDCRPTFRPLAWEQSDGDESVETLDIPENLHVGGDAEVGGTLTANLLRGNLVAGAVDTPHLRDRSVSANKLGTGAVGLRQLHDEVGVVPSGFSIVGESPTAPAGYSYTHQQISVSNHRPVWRQRLPLAGTDVGRVVCLVVEGALFALLDNGEIWRSEGGSAPWHLDAEMRPVRRDFGAAVLNGCIHIVGGQTVRGKALADHDIFDPEQRTWRKGPKLPTPLTGAGVAVVDNVMFVLGGLQGWFLPSSVRDLIDPITPDMFLGASRTTRNVHAFDPGNARWVVCHSMPTGRSHMGVAVSNNRIHMVGGNQRRPMGTAQPTSAHEAYLPSAGVWESRMPLQEPTAFLGLAAVEGQLHAVGGMGWSGLSAVHTTYTPLSDSWMPTPPLDVPRRDAGVAECFGEVYVLGGVTPSGPTSAAQSCNVAQTLYLHQKNDGGVGLAHDGSVADTGNPSAPGGSARVGADTLAPIAALAASVAAVSAASLAMDPDHAARGTRGPPAIPGGGGASAPALDTPSKIKQGGEFIMVLVVIAIVLGLLFLMCAGGLKQFPAVQQRLQNQVQQVFPNMSVPFAPTVPVAAPEPPPDLSNCLPVSGAPTAINVGTITPANAAGVDVSHFQQSVPWNLLQQAGVSFAYAKATQGRYNQDPTFAANWQGMKDCAILRGAYHFYEPHQDPFKQAQNFLAALQGSPGDLPAVIDVERGMLLHNKDCKKLLPNIVHFAETVQRGTGMPPVIYASAAFWNEKFSCSDEPLGAAAVSTLAGFPLWVAKYDAGTPSMFGGWTSYAFWQYTDQGMIGTTNIDLDRFAYGTPVLKAWLKAIKTDPTKTPAQVAATMPPPAATAAAPVAPGVVPPTPVAAPVAPTAIPTAAPTPPAAPTLPVAPSAPSLPTALPGTGG